MSEDEIAAKFALRYTGPIDLMDICGTNITAELFLKGTTIHDETSKTGAGEFSGIIWGLTGGRYLSRVREEFGDPIMVVGSPETPYKDLLAMLGSAPQGQPLAANAERDALWAILDIEVEKISFFGPKVMRALTRRELKYIGQVVTIPSYENLGAFGILSTILKNRLERWLNDKGLNFGMNTMDWVPPNHPSRTGTQA